MPDTSTSHAGTAPLTAEQWRSRAAAHAARVDGWTAGRLARRSRGERHPVDDFLFDYYPYRPGRLRQWHPGHGVVLLDADNDYAHRPCYVRGRGGVHVSDDAVAARMDEIASSAELLRRTRGREARFDCFARHEWAMVYRVPAGDVRHPSWPLRVGPDRIEEVVERQPLHCTHFDAFRFFSASAEPLNVVRPSRATAAQFEQGGCLHAGMDLYKWTVRLLPMTSSELVADCFAHARDLRQLDMRASPYDLRALGLEPIPIETAVGRAEFASAQRELAARSDTLRRRVIDALEYLAAVAR